MRTSFVFGCAAVVTAVATASVGCASYPAPTEHLANSMASIRAAQEVGAPQVPQAALHLKLAEDQVAQAKELMKDGKNERADYMTLRAYNDAALALALTREEQARTKGKAAVEQRNAPPRAP